MEILALFDKQNSTEQMFKGQITKVTIQNKLMTATNYNVNKIM